MVRRITAVLAATMAAVLGAAAHEIPNDVKLNIFLKPEGNRLTLLIRAPLAAMNEAELPLRGPGYLQVSRADEALRGAVKLYLTDNIAVHENDAALPAPRVVQARVSLPSDKSFTSYEEALAHLESGARLADEMDLYWNQLYLDV